MCCSVPISSTRRLCTIGNADVHVLPGAAQLRADTRYAVEFVCSLHTCASAGSRLLGDVAIFTSD